MGAIQFDFDPDDAPAVVADAAVLGGVALLLVGIHYLLPAPARARLAFDYVAAEPLTLLTAAYVHGSTAHLFGNLLGYVVGAVYAYGLCVGVGRRPWFRRTAPLLFLVLPVVVNLVSFVALSAQFPDATPVSRGFSGVVGGFTGFLFVALFVAVRQRRDVQTATGVVLGVTLLLVYELAVTRAGVDPATTLLVAVGVFAALVGAGATRIASVDRRTALEVVLVTVVLSLLLRSLFPATPAATPFADQSVFAHAAGVVFGACFAVVTAVRG